MFYSVRSENVKLKIAFTDDIDGVLHRFLYLLVKISPIEEFQTKERSIFKQNFKGCYNVKQLLALFILKG